MPLNDRQNYTRPDGGIDEDVLRAGKKSEYVGRKPFVALNHPNYEAIFGHRGPKRAETRDTPAESGDFHDLRRIELAYKDFNDSIKGKYR